MPHGRQLLLATLILAASHTGVEAEIDRVSIEAALSEFLAGRVTAAEPDATISFAGKDLVFKVPEAVRVVLPPDAKLQSSSVRAVFAVKPPGGEVGDTLIVRMKLMDGRTYGVARWSQRAFRSWLLRRMDDLVRGNVVLEDIVGQKAEGISFHLSFADMAEDPLALAEDKPVMDLADLARRTLEPVWASAPSTW